MAALALVAAPTAFAAAPPTPPYNVHVMYFSNTVSGTAPAAATGVTVNLLRTSTDYQGDETVWNKIASVTATPSPGWSASFPSGTDVLPGDQIEVIYAGTIANDPPTSEPTGDSPQPSPSQITIGLGNDDFQGSDQYTTDADGNPVNDTVDFSGSPWNDFVVNYDGSSITCYSSDCEDTYGYDDSTGTDYFYGFQASVGGGTAQSTATSNTTDTPDDDLSLSPAATSSEGIELTTTTSLDDWYDEYNDSDEASTAVSLSFPAPQLSIEDQPTSSAPSGTTPVNWGGGTTDLPTCEAYLVYDEVTCSGLNPGSYTLTDGGTTASFTVANPTVLSTSDGDDYQELAVPDEGGASVPGLAAGQTVTLSEGGDTLDSILVDSLKFTATTPLGDLFNGANTTVTGSCQSNLDIDGNSDDFCTNGAIPSSNDLYDGSDEYQADPIGRGGTDVSLPGTTLNTSYDTDIWTPFVVTAEARYEDPITGYNGVDYNNAEAVPPQNGQIAVPSSTSSTDPVTFEYATLNPTTGATGSWVTLGNVNTAGGLTLPPTLATGWYTYQYVVTDSNGDSDTYDNGEFYNQGATTSTLAAPSCTAKIKGGGLKKATVASKKKKSKKSKKKSKKKKTSKTSTLTFTCKTVSKANVALWLEKSSGSVVTDGSAVASKAGKATIKITDLKIKKGLYKLVEVVDSNGQSKESDTTITLKS